MRGPLLVWFTILAALGLPVIAGCKRGASNCVFVAHVTGQPGAKLADVVQRAGLARVTGQVYLGYLPPGMVAVPSRNLVPLAGGPSPEPPQGLPATVGADRVGLLQAMVARGLTVGVYGDKGYSLPCIVLVKTGDGIVRHDIGRFRCFDPTLIMYGNGKGVSAAAVRSRRGRGGGALLPVRSPAARLEACDAVVD